MKIFDISRPIVEGMSVWPGDPEFRQKQVQKITAGALSNLAEIQMGTHTGTHIDAPLHVSDGGIDVAAIALHKCIGPARLIAISNEESIRPEMLASLDWSGVARVLFRTGNSAVPEDRFNPGYTFLEPEAARFLVSRGILLVGVDAPSIDAFKADELRSHKILTENGIVIVEGLWLGGVPPGDYMLACLPLKLAGLDGSPVRAVLWQQEI